MAVKLMSLRMALDDEVEAMLALLEHHHIASYYTPEGSFGVSAAALWLQDEQDLAQAQSLIQSYQQTRAEEAKADYAVAQQQGTQATWLENFQKHPLLFVLSILGIIFFTYLLFVPVLDLGK